MASDASTIADSADDCCSFSSTGNLLPLVSLQERASLVSTPRAGRAGEAALGDRADHLGDFCDDLADLVLADDQRRGQRQGIPGDAQHQVIVVERAV